MLQKTWQDNFDDVFSTQYSTIHRYAVTSSAITDKRPFLLAFADRLETNKLRNVAKFFAHLLCTDALPWTCMEYIRLNEEDTTSSSRIFIKVLMLELSEGLGLAKLRY
jgi:pre-mRNA-splicing factor CWC22